MKRIYLVMEWAYDNTGPDPHIEVIGIFSTKEKAINECLTENYFWGEFEIDKAVHDKNIPWSELMTDDPYPIKQQA